MFNARQRNKTWNVAGLKLHEDVNVAVWTEVVTEHRTEQREATNVVPLAELRDLIVGNTEALCDDRVVDVISIRHFLPPNRRAPGGFRSRPPRSFGR